MLTEEEKSFLKYWEIRRVQKRKILWQLAGGLPLAAFLVVAIFINYFSGWYTRAAIKIRMDASGILVVLAALVLIIIFIVIFSARHKWDMNEQRYKELKMKEEEKKI